ncbi:MAG: adenylosuccinate synthetase [Patescibacteria group bacterium]
MQSTELLSLYKHFLDDPNPVILTPQKPFGAPSDSPPLKNVPGSLTQIRPRSISVEDAFFGDSGKGAVVAKLNARYGKKSLYSLRYNGGANAGHETFIHGKRIVTKQLPMAVIQEQATAFISRGVVLHVNDLLYEIDWIRELFGGSMPGRLVIDSNTPLVLDTHRAREAAVNQFTLGGRGSTGRGIAPAYESWYGRYPVLLRDLLSDDWKNHLSAHYDFYSAMLTGHGLDLATMEVLSLNPDYGQKSSHPVGTKKTFLKRLAWARAEIKPYVEADMFQRLSNAWHDTESPFIIEGAQGIGLDPYHGVYPDITSSRPGSRNVNDATYNIILPEEIGLRGAVMKTTYLSSVGKRRLPHVADETFEHWIQETFDERGRVTGRLRDIYPVSIPIARYLRRAAGYDSLFPTHLDACKEDTVINVLTHYTHKETGKESPYLPYQYVLDELEPHYIEFPGWDGSAVAQAKDPEELPEACRRYLAFISQVIAPVALATTGPEIDNWVGWID